MTTNENPGVYSNFTFRCAVCGATVRVVGSSEQPHVCRIEIR